VFRIGERRIPVGGDDERSFADVLMEQAAREATKTP